MNNSESFHILVTDINQHVRNFLQRELEKEGYTVQSVKTGSIVWERISGAAEVDLIVLDPELFASFDQTFIDRIICQNSSLQIIIHTYADSLGDITAGENIHLVAKDGQSIGPLKSVIRTCFELFRDRKAY
jgi:CheY-like chemotaxis protein